MNRRRLLAALGGLAGTGSAVGTGAFTSVNANRSVEVQVADDADALLALSPCDGPNGDYVTTSGGTAAIDVTASNGNIDGSGVNAEATTVADDVLEIRNQGTQSVGVWLDVDPVEQDGTDRLQFYVDGDPSSEIVGQGNARCLGVGESVCVGFSADTTGIGSTTDLVEDGTVVVNADASVGCSAGSVPGVSGGPLAHYPFDGGAVDATGNGYDASPVGDVSYTGGYTGQAAAFDGDGDRLSADTDLSGAFGSGVTIASWVNTDVPTGWRTIAALTDASAGGNNPPALLRESTDGSWEFFVDTATGTTFPDRVQGGNVSTGTWTHVAGTYDGSTVRVYVDGTEVASGAHAGTLDAPVDGILVGAWQLGDGEFVHHWDGELDDVRIYDRALSASEVAALASTP